MPASRQPAPRALDGTVERWREQAKEWEVLGVQVNGAALIRQLLSDLEKSEDEVGEELLNLQQAALECGLTSGYLGRLVRQGKIVNAGRPNAPRVRRSDLRMHRRDLPRQAKRVQLVRATPGQIVQSVARPHFGGAR